MWAVVEVMGHRRYAGQIEETTLAGAPVLRVHVPELVAESQEIDWRRRPAADGGGEERWTRKVTRRYPGHVVDLGGGALFAVTRCPEAHARAALRHSHHEIDPEETHGDWTPPVAQLPGPVEDAEVVEDGSEFMHLDGEE